MTEVRNVDVVVLGVGGMGSAACYSLAKRGQSVIGIEQFGIAHTKGSSQGASRLIRRAYFEHADYVPLLNRAYELWHEIMQVSGRKIMHETGVLILGPESGGTIVPAAVKAARAHQIKISQASSADAKERFPQFQPPDRFTTMYEEQAGYLEVENCVGTIVQLAQSSGAEIYQHERVLSWKSSGAAVEIKTDTLLIRADKMVVTCGPWTGAILKDLVLPLKVHRVPSFWFDAAPAYSVGAGMPCFGVDLEEGFFYGVPAFDQDGVKIGLHKPGDLLAAPSEIDHGLNQDELAAVHTFIDRFLPGVTKRLRKHAACMYTMTPDEHFIVDRHPQFANIFFAAGFSGHGFKFTPVIGEVLGDWCISGTTDHPVDFLSLGRFAT